MNLFKRRDPASLRTMVSFGLLMKNGKMNHTYMKLLAMKSYMQKDKMITGLLTLLMEHEEYI